MREREAKEDVVVEHLKRNLKLKLASVFAALLSSIRRSIRSDPIESADFKSDTIQSRLAKRSHPCCCRRLSRRLDRAKQRR